jgi:hypothetical protein
LINVQVNLIWVSAAHPGWAAGLFGSAIDISE